MPTIDNQKAIEKVKNRVEKWLKEDPYCRNDDRYLVWRIWNEVGKIYIPFEILKVLPSPETITRARRKLQEQNPELRAAFKVRGHREERQTELKLWAVST